MQPRAPLRALLGHLGLGRCRDPRREEQPHLQPHLQHHRDPAQAQGKPGLSYNPRTWAALTRPKHLEPRYKLSAQQGVGDSQSVTCPAASCTKRVKLGLLACPEAHGQNGLSFLLPPGPPSSRGSLVHRRERRTSAACTDGTAALLRPARHQGAQVLSAPGAEMGGEWEIYEPSTKWGRTA